MIKIVTTFSKWHFREVLEETGYNIGEKIDPDQYSEQVLNDQVCDFLNTVLKYEKELFYM